MFFTACILFALKSIIMGLFGATNYVQTFKCLTIIYALASIIVWLIASIIDEFTKMKVTLCVGSWFGLSAVTLVYFLVCESKAISVVGSFYLTIKIFLIAEFVLGGIWCIYSYFENKKQAELNQTMILRAKKEINIVKKQIADTSKQLTEYIAIYESKLTKMTEDLESMNEQLAESENALEALYMVKCLHPKYQNWVAAATIYEYLDTGRCSTLDGPYGAYNLFEQELTNKKIVGSIEEAIESINKNGAEYLKCQEKLSKMVLGALLTKHR